MTLCCHDEVSTCTALQQNDHGAPVCILFTSCLVYYFENWKGWECKKWLWDFSLLDMMNESMWARYLSVDELQTGFNHSQIVLHSFWRWTFTTLNFKGIITVFLDSEVYIMIHFFLFLFSFLFFLQKTKNKKKTLSSIFIIMCFSGQFYLQDMVL